MDKFIILPKQDKLDVFQEAATRHGVLPIIIEKDFWVCWTLKQLYSIPEFAEYITFKGGTSLSKAYGLIDRFSEDIDLTISKNMPGLTDVKDPTEEGISGKERDRRVAKLMQDTQNFIKSNILHSIHNQFAKVLGSSGNWKLELDETDSKNILFYYPKVLSYEGRFFGASFGEASFAPKSYIRPAIKLEFGARGDTTPSASKNITPYIAEEFSNLFSNASCSVPTLAAERTFWEKATILHALYHGSKMRDRMSRHYYDTYMLTAKGLADAALGNLQLLEQVVLNKSIFFKDSKASYETAKIGSLKLVPNDGLLSELRKDYAAMGEMLMFVVPEFDDIISTLKQLEDKINSKKH